MNDRAGIDATIRRWEFDAHSRIMDAAAGGPATLMNVLRDLGYESVEHVQFATEHLSIVRARGPGELFAKSIAEFSEGVAMVPR